MSAALAERPAQPVREVRTNAGFTPADMLGIAVQQGADLAKLEKLIELQERWERNQARKAFDEAIASAKAEIRPVVKNRVVDFSSRGGKTNYAYEDFAQVAACVDPSLSKYGLSYRFRSKQEGKTLTVVCVMSHRDGHSEETSLSAPNDESGNKNAIQAIGSAATYLQRYTLKLALGLASGHDNDATDHGRHPSANGNGRQDDEPADEGPKPSPAMVNREIGSSVRELATLKGVEPAMIESKLLAMVKNRFQNERSSFAACTPGELHYVADSLQTSIVKARAESEAGTAVAAPLPTDKHPTLERGPGDDGKPWLVIPRSVSGSDLSKRLREADTRLAANGVCQAGALLAHVQGSLRRAGYGADMTKWSADGPAIDLVEHEVNAFVRPLLPGAYEREPGIDDEEPDPAEVQPGRLPAKLVDGLFATFHECQTSWEKVRAASLSWLGRKLDATAHLSTLTLDEAVKADGYAKAEKAKRDKAKAAAEAAA